MINNMEKIFYVGECKGNNDNGCFLDSCGHDCGCFKKVLKETSLEEAAERYTEFWLENEGLLLSDAFIAGAKWQAERMNSEKELLEFAKPIQKCKCGQNTLPYKAQFEINKCSRCGNDR